MSASETETLNDIDEGTPLLRDSAVGVRKASYASSTCDRSCRVRPPFPWGQFSILLILQLAEPMTYQVIGPFAPQLIRDLDVAHGDEKKVGYYVGVLVCFT
jgi:hypothetical protein